MIDTMFHITETLGPALIKANQTSSCTQERLDLTLKTVGIHAEGSPDVFVVFSKHQAKVIDQLGAIDRSIDLVSHIEQFKYRDEKHFMSNALNLARRYIVKVTCATEEFGYTVEKVSVNPVEQTQSFELNQVELKKYIDTFADSLVQMELEKHFFNIVRDTEVYEQWGGW